ncbi:hypothetical protein ATK30_7571 [Amycolatopsis echigonensis]|uniref:Uncharacterized protein n=1 Tax=Amycolatopsis echigonensis TaxID=2576905 RepID=A0A2N3WRX3_9PSEU|nr:hypothetical protein ATK30_7571 [Amycolatopsis niigatensis]
MGAFRPTGWRELQKKAPLSTALEESGTLTVLAKAHSDHPPTHREKGALP